jgi:endonuclease YncB( thermonuclease family)
MPTRASDGRRAGSWLAAAAVAGWLGLAGAAVAAEPIRGVPFVADGDTLGFGERQVRLYGIDAPEADQTGGLLGREAPIGEWATQTLRRLIGHDEVACYPLTQPSRGRVTAKCHTATVPDLGRAMVAAGFAWDFKRQSHSIYEDDEAGARARKLGVWAGDDACQAPWNWRRR